MNPSEDEIALAVLAVLRKKSDARFTQNKLWEEVNDVLAEAKRDSAGKGSYQKRIESLEEIKAIAREKVGRQRIVVSIGPTAEELLKSAPNEMLKRIMAGLDALMANESENNSSLHPSRKPDMIKKVEQTIDSTDPTHTYTFFGETNGTTGVFTLNSDILVTPLKEQLVIPKGMDLNIRSRLLSGPPLTILLQYANDGRTFRILRKIYLTSEWSINAEKFMSSAGTEAVKITYTGAKASRPSSVAFDLEFVGVMHNRSFSSHG